MVTLSLQTTFLAVISAYAVPVIAPEFDATLLNLDASGASQDTVLEFAELAVVDDVPVQDKQPAA